MKPKIPNGNGSNIVEIHSSRSWQNACNSVLGTLAQSFRKLDLVFDNQVPTAIWGFRKRKTLPGDTPFHPGTNNVMSCYVDRATIQRWNVNRATTKCLRKKRRTRLEK